MNGQSPIPDGGNDSNVVGDNNTVSVSQLQTMDRDPRFGGIPIYEQESRAR